MNFWAMVDGSHLTLPYGYCTLDESQLLSCQDLRPHPKSLSQIWERDFESGSPSPKLGRRGWGMRVEIGGVEPNLQEVY